MKFRLRDLATGEKRTVSREEFEAVLDVAAAFGWIPEGTNRDGDARWSGSYLSNSGQVIARTDGTDLAQALELAAEHLMDPVNICFTPDQLYQWAALLDGGNVQIS